MSAVAEQSEVPLSTRSGTSRLGKRPAVCPHARDPGPKPAAPDLRSGVEGGCSLRPLGARAVARAVLAARHELRAAPERVLVPAPANRRAGAVGADEQPAGHDTRSDRRPAVVARERFFVLGARPLQSGEVRSHGTRFAARRRRRFIVYSRWQCSRSKVIPPGGGDHPPRHNRTRASRASSRASGG